jgi:hypothetical protein
VPRILRRALTRSGVADAAVVDATDEDSAVRAALAWARPGDVLVLALHTREGRGSALALIDRLRSESWIAGQPLPA